jgi:2-C-methyl-D-erythritol 4-phosphate cytidylyltransferase
MGGPVSKLYLTLRGRAVLARALDALLAHPRVACAVVVLAPDDGAWDALTYTHAKAVTAVRGGGATRAHSVLAGLRHLAGQHDSSTPVLVHDGARPLLTAADLDALIAAPLDAGGAALASPVVDTLRRGRDAQGLHSAGVVERTGLWRVHTPQRASLGVLRTALEGALAAGLDPGDELAALEHAGHRPRLVPGRADNLKLTTPEDLDLAAAVLALRA